MIKYNNSSSNATDYNIVTNNSSLWKRESGYDWLAMQATVGLFEREGFRRMKTCIKLVCGFLQGLFQWETSEKLLWSYINTEQFQKISIFLSLKGLGGGGSLQGNLKKCKKLNWNFQRGGNARKKSLSLGEVRNQIEYFMELQFTE